MSQITTEHNGHQIVYAENEDVWRCWGMDLEAKTLSALKTKMNAADAAARRVGNVRVFIIPSYSGDIEEGLVTLLEGDGHAWVVPPAGKKEVRGRRSRAKTEISSLALDTPAAREAIEAWDRAREFSREAAQAERDAKAAIPRATRADLAGTPTGGGSGQAA